jgi:hypothetical protein
MADPLAAPLPVAAPLDAYERQAAGLLAAHRAGAREAIEFFHGHHPRFLDAVVPWLPRPIADEEIAGAQLTLDDARLALARGYSFRDWDALRSLVREVARQGSDVQEFERAAEAVITGDRSTLSAMLRASPDLVRARSTRITCHDPAVHGATLLHYVAANGVEGHRQKTPPDAVEIARLLLDAGAEVDAFAGMYGGDCTTLSMLVSSTPPAEAGVQVPLVHTLLDFGAEVEGRGSTRWSSPLMTALVFGFRAAADAMVARGARVDHIAAAAGLGREAEALALLPAASADGRHRALALAAQLGNTEVVRLLLDAGEDPDRFNPEGLHAHATPLHHAAGAGHLPVVRLLVERGARLDLVDTLWRATPLGWARHGRQTAVVEYLLGKGAQG